MDLTPELIGAIAAGIASLIYAWRQGGKAKVMEAVADAAMEELPKKAAAVAVQKAADKLGRAAKKAEKWAPKKGWPEPPRGWPR